ncbi:hypothetical protein BSF42_44380 [Flavobacterium sp. ACN6]|nr:hypothetical protein BSF42_44380 [Flavobacterium sp. ACN6]
MPSTLTTNSAGIVTWSPDLPWILNGNKNGALKTIGTQDAFDLPFITSNTEKMRITKTGYVGVSTNNPSSKLHILANNESSNSADDLRIETYSNIYSPSILLDRSRGTQSAPVPLAANDPIGSIVFRSLNGGGATSLSTISATYQGNGTTNASDLVFSTSGTPKMTLTQTGWLYPASDGTQLLGASNYRWSAVYAAGGVIQTSDIRMKANIKPLQYGLADVLKIDPITYSWKTDATNKMMLGVSAQQLQTILPEAVNVGEDENKTLGVNYSEIIPVLINAVKEQQKEIDAKDAKIKQLEERMLKIEKLLEK